MNSEISDLEADGKKAAVVADSSLPSVSASLAPPGQGQPGSPDADPQMATELKRGTRGPSDHPLQQSDPEGGKYFLGRQKDLQRDALIA